MFVLLVVIDFACWGSWVDFTFLFPKLLSCFSWDFVIKIMHNSNITQRVFDDWKWGSKLHKPPDRINIFYLIPCDCNTSAFTQLLLPNEWIVMRKRIYFSRWLTGELFENLPCDGIVVKVASGSTKQKLGVTSKCSNWAIAMKDWI